MTFNTNKRSGFAYPRQFDVEVRNLAEASPFRNGIIASMLARKVPVRPFKTRPGFGIYETDTLRTFGDPHHPDLTVKRWVKNKFIVRTECQHWAPNAQDCRFECEKAKREAALSE